MSSWMNDAAAVQNHNGAGFNHINDSNRNNMLDSPSYNIPSNQTSFDPSQFQNPQNLQRMQNGAPRTQSPSFNNPVYQTNSVIPSKRQREETMATSPRQSQGMLPASRSQTPQQAGYTGFQPNSNPSQPPSQPTPYGHLQHNGSANATPSPVMGNQLRPGSVPQRVATTSPHPFSPAAQQFSAQGSPPPHSDHGSRVNTPQNSQYMQNGAYKPGPAYSGPPSSISTAHMQQQPGQPSLQFQQNAQSSQAQQANQKIAYQMRLQQSLAQSNMLAAQHAQSMGQVPNNMPKPPQMPSMNGQFSQGVRPQQSPQSNPTPQNPEAFMKKLIGFMQSHNQPLDVSPVVGDRQISLVMLYMAVSKFGGYKRTCQMNGWSQISQALKIQPSTAPNAPQQLKQHYEKNLLMFEEAWTGIQQRQAQIMRQNPAMAAAQSSQMSPTKQMNFPSGVQQSPQYMQHLQQQQHQQNMAQQQQLQQQQALNTPMKQMQPVQSLPSINGFTPPPGNQAQANNHGHVRNTLSRSMDPSPTQNGTGFTVPSPSVVRKSSNVTGLLSPKHENLPDQKSNANVPKDLAKEYEPWLRPLMDTWGGHAIASLCQLGEEISIIKPNVPSVGEMGAVDIQALNLSLQSGLQAEVRYALDTLATLSNEHRIVIDLRYCDDLMESLVDCAEEQVELLAESADEVYDLDITSYEDVVRGCLYEQDTLQEVPSYGSQEYELDRAVDRLICITTILRNFSFVEWNLKLLADQIVVKFLSTVIRYLGTRHMLLRRHSNTLDFMKDVIVFLSNIGQDIILPGKDQATHLLLFVLAFAPSPPPDMSSSKPFFFTPYDPTIHKYLPPAVDCLAKLLARDEPNRTFYRSIFTTESHHPSTSFDLLTKTFALAISPVPEFYSRKALLPTVELRKPFLMQGMLAAEILVNLAPGFETGVTRTWLASQDGFAHSLMRLVEYLCKEAAHQTQMEAQYEAQQRAAHGQRGRGPLPHEGLLNPLERGSLAVIAQRAVRILKRLVEKCLDPNDKESVKGVPVGVWPKQESLLGAQVLRDIDPVVLAGLLALAKLEDGVVR